MPLSGEGVNLAMLDAADLARAISECRSLEEAVRTYEGTMFTRAARAARGADEGLKNAIAPDAATHIPPVFRQAQQAFERLLRDLKETESQPARTRKPRGASNFR